MPLSNAERSRRKRERQRQVRIQQLAQEIASSGGNVRILDGFPGIRILSSVEMMPQENSEPLIPCVARPGSAPLRQAYHAPKAEYVHQSRQRPKEQIQRPRRQPAANDCIEGDMTEYFEATLCKRVALGSIMDGAFDQEDTCHGCKRLCNLCRERQEVPSDLGRSDENAYLIRHNLGMQAITAEAPH